MNDKNPPAKWEEKRKDYHIFWSPNFAIYGIVFYDGMWCWEARVDYRCRLTKLPIQGKAPTIEQAKKIVEFLLENTNTYKQV